MVDIARDGKIYAWYYNNQETHDCLDGENFQLNKVNRKPQVAIF